MRGQTRIRLCGELEVTWQGRPLELPGRQGRLLFAYLVLGRKRPVRRDELIDALWTGDGAPTRGDALLSPPLSRLRKALGGDAIGGRSELRLTLPDDAWVDWEAALDAQERTRAALRASDFRAAWTAASEAIGIADQGLLPGFDGDWIAQRRRELAALSVEMLESLATAGVALGGVDLAVAERAGRTAIESAPFRESAYAALMEVLRARGNVAEALRVYETLRARLSEELGATPSARLVALHKRLLQAEAQPPPVRRRATSAPPPPVGDQIVEREAEVLSLATLVDQTAAGGGRIVLIEGPAGIGKSRLLLEARRQAAGRSVRTLIARGSELEREFPFGVVRQLFEAIAGDPDECDRALAGAAAPAAAVFGVPSEHASAGDASFAALHGLFWLTLNLSAEAPLVLAIDDLQWCDLASLRFIAYLAHRLEDVPLLVVATLRSGEPPADDTLLADIAQEPATAFVRPRPLSEAAVETLVRGRLGANAEAEFSFACGRATGGNPLLLRQLLTALAADGVEPLAANVDVVRDVGPRAVSRSVLVRLARLRGEAVRVARAVAVLGDSADLPAVAGLAGLDEWRVAEATGALARAELLRPESPFGFLHPLIRDAVYRELPPGERELQHWRAARVLGDQNAPSEQVSAHLLVIPRRGDAWVAETLQDAGRSAMSRGAPESAVAYFQRALAEPPAPEARAGLLFELGIAEGLTDAPAAAEHLAAAHAELTDPYIRSVAADALVRVLMFVAPPQEAAGLARQAIDELAGATEPLLADERERLQALRMIAWFFGSQDEQMAVALERERRRSHDRGPGARMIAAAASYDWTMQAGPHDACAQLALEALEGGSLIEAENGLCTSFAAISLVAAERDEALVTYERLLADAHRRGSLFTASATKLWHGYAHLTRGQLEDAEALLRASLDEMIAWGHAFAQIWPSAYLGATLIERGDLAGARAALDRGGPLTVAQGSLPWLVAHSELLLAEGDADGAIAAADEAAARAGRLVNPALLPWRSAKARALDRRGDEDAARTLVREELDIVRGWGSPGAVGRTLTTLGTLERDDGVDRLREAARLLASSPLRLEHAKALAALGSTLRRARRPSDAREPLRQALELADACSAAGLAEHVRAELYATGARPRTEALSGVGSLTASERRVADLALDGRTNRDIAQELFVTPKTVEVHLSNAYRKLGIRSRRDLAGALA